MAGPELPDSDNLELIADSAELADFCAELAREPYITVDTEFIREKTFWPILCLVQMSSAHQARAIDALADGLDFTPLYELMANPNVLKVFHAARQDLEIFHHSTGLVPAPIYDTQIAAMVCGFGDSIAYDKLIKRTVGVHLDKGATFTDWRRRPLKQKQITYALADVSYLWQAYAVVSEKVDKANRHHWMDEEMATITNAEIYAQVPDKAWQRLKIRSRKAAYLGVLKEVAAWREQRAQERDVPRKRILRDESIQELAAEPPHKQSDLAHFRSVPKGLAEGSTGKDLISAVERGLDMAAGDLPNVPAREDRPNGTGSVAELLKVLLKRNCERHGVSQRLIANAEDLERLAACEEPDIPAVKGWRREVFGEDALALKRGDIGLALRNGHIDVVRREKGNPDGAYHNGRNN